MNLLKTVALLGFLSALLVLIGYLLIGGTVGAIIGLGIAVVTNFTSWFYSAQIALAVYGAKSPTHSQAKLFQPMVERLCDRANLPLPKIYVVPSGAANAFATGRNPKHGAIAVTQGLIHLLSLEPGIQSTPIMMKTSKSQRRNQVATSVAIALAAFSLAYAPIPGLTQTVVVVSGTELQEPLKVLETKFERENPGIHLELKFQGSQDMVNKYIDDKNDFKPTVLIPANGQILKELSDRTAAQGNNDPYYEPPRPIAKTQLVGIAWSERGKVLFPDGRFSWQRIEQAMQAGNWQAVGGDRNWGSFDFVTTDPTRSNSGQLTLSLWAISKLGGSSLNSATLNTPPIQSLLSLVKRSVYQPPRSTDILLQEFIARGPNDADVATVYESVALSRWQQAATTQGKPYQIYYLNPTIETTSTAAIVRRDVNSLTAKAASKFLDFLTKPESMSVFVQYGFRPANNSIDLKSLPNSPWSKNIPGAQVNPVVQTTAAPSPTQLTEIQRLWERVN